jgi:hypothetical protein
VRRWTGCLVCCLTALICPSSFMPPSSGPGPCSSLGMTLPWLCWFGIGISSKVGILRTASSKISTLRCIMLCPLQKVLFTWLPSSEDTLSVSLRILSVWHCMLAWGDPCRVPCFISPRSTFSLLGGLQAGWFGDLCSKVHHFKNL